MDQSFGTRPLTYLVFEGTADPLVPYQSVSVAFFCCAFKRGANLGVSC